MVKLSQFKSDLDKERLGVWITFAEGIRFRVARMGNAQYVAASRELLKPHRDRIRRGVMDEEEIERLSLSAIAEHILTGWENIDDDAGNAVPYSPAKAAEILGDPQYRDVYDFVLSTARRSELYRIQDREIDLGNSQTASDGSSSGGSTSQSLKSPSGEESA